jgi:Restriction endonuclease
VREEGELEVMPNDTSSKGPINPKWKLFEKLVAAIHRAELKGADVRWNDKINGRQFDVTVRFKTGMYTYLTVIECRAVSSPLKVERIDAFATKYRDAKANKAIMVASVGFQDGCFEVAERHGIELFTLRELEEFPEEALEEGLIPTLNFHSVTLHCGKADESDRLELPEERNILPYLVKETFIERGRDRLNIEAIVDFLCLSLLRVAGPEPKVHRIDLRKGSAVTLPDIKSGNTLETITLPVKALEFCYQVIPARYLKGTGLDPYLLRGRYEFKNVVTGDSRVYDPRDLGAGFDTMFAPGKFYSAIHSEFRYFCHQVDGDLITLTMLEGYQHGKHLQATFKVLRENADNFVEITDEKEVERLKAMLNTLRRKSGAKFGGDEVA